MTEAKDEAADCPWCGPMRRHYGFTIGRFGARVHCFCCDAMGPIGATQEQALENWNRRAATLGSGPIPSALSAGLVEWRRQAVQAEREACAKVADARGWPGIMLKAEYDALTESVESAMDCGTAIAAAIRARGDG